MHSWRVAIILLVGTVFIIGTPAVRAAGSASLVAATAQVEGTVGEHIEIHFDLHPGGEAIDTVRLHVEFDPAVLAVEDVRASAFLPRTSPGNVIEGERGRISYGAFTTTPIRSRGTIATITFRARGPGTTEVRLLPTSRIIAGGEERGNPSAFRSARVTVRSVATPLADAEVLIQSATHPDQGTWYQGRSVEFQWEPAAGPVKSPTFRVGFDARPDGPPTEDVGTATSWRTDGIGDGVWYFHLQRAGAGSDRATIVHRRVRIDGTPPNEIALLAEPQQLSAGEPVTLRFGTTDDGSGIDRYELAQNGGSFMVALSPLEFTDLLAGTHFLQVRALDRARNAIYGQTTIRVYPSDNVVGGDGQRTLSALFESHPWWVWTVVLLLVVSIVGILVHSRR